MRRFPKWLLWGGVAVVATVIAALAVALYAVLRPQSTPTEATSTDLESKLNATQVAIAAMSQRIESEVIEGKDISATQFLRGTLATAAQPNITSVGELSSLTVTGETHVPEPTQTIHIATKGYVDNFLQGVQWLESVVTKTDSNINLAAISSPIGGYAVINEDRVLVTQQTTATENGIYRFLDGTLVRTADFDGSPVFENFLGQGVLVTAGTYAGTRWIVTTPLVGLNASPVVQVGTDEVKWVQFTGTNLTAVNPYYFIETSTSQTISHSTNTVVRWQNRVELHNRGDFTIDVDEKKVTIPVTGIYIITYEIFYNLAVSSRVASYVQTDASSLSGKKLAVVQVIPTISDTGLNGVCSLFLEQGDQVWVNTWHASGENESIHGNSAHAKGYFSLLWVTA